MNEEPPLSICIDDALIRIAKRYHKNPTELKRKLVDVLLNEGEGQF